MALMGSVLLAILAAIIGDKLASAGFFGLALVSLWRWTARSSEWLVALQRVLHVTDMGYTGLALATSIAATVNALFLFMSSRRLFGPLLVGADWVAFGTTALASTAMGAF